MTDKSLPILAVKKDILDAYDRYQTLLIIGETGSGKTTQIPKFIYEHDKKSRIVITQPRRVAAISLAHRVAQEIKERNVGGLVGYSIRFDDMTSAETRIKFATDGMLLREVISDPLLSKYSTIILDEAHERTLRTDILFGIVKRIQAKRKLKVIIMSATLDPEKFQSFFMDSHVLTVPGRQYPVRIMYAEEPQQDYLDAAILTIFQLHQEKPEGGDILVFLTGQEEIEAVEQLLIEYSPLCAMESPKMITCPVHASLPSFMQMNVFKPTPKGCRKVILATNIAETSITIPNVKYVIDPGFAKMRLYNFRNGMETLTVKPISKSSARQRAGRAGRDGPGECYRLFTEDSFDSLEQETSPEITRTNLSNVILMMKASNIENVIHFDYLDCPPLEALQKGLEELLALGALNDKGQITKVGKMMADCPLVPQLSRVLLCSKNLQCTSEILTIISMLSVENVFRISSSFNIGHGTKACDDGGDGENVAVQSSSKKKYHHPEGDHLTLLNTFKAYSKLKGEQIQNWCSLNNHLDPKSLKQVSEIRNQLYEYCKKNHIDPDVTSLSLPSSDSNILKCLVGGFFLQTAFLQPDGTYKTVLGKRQAFIHPSSTLHYNSRENKPECIIYHELMLTSKCYMRFVSRIDPSWIQEQMKSRHLEQSQ